MRKLDFSYRANEPELMDSPDSDEARLLRTVEQFALLNRLFSSSRRLIRKYILHPLMQEGIKRFSLLDIGAGGCDIPIWIVQYCRKRGVKAAITCIDYDARVLAYARNQCADYPEITVQKQDARSMQDLGSFDYIFANHFLHHLDERAIIAVLQQSAAMAKRGFLFNDIYRCRMAYWLFTFFAGIFMHNSFAFYDGRLSIRKGFREMDLRHCVREAGVGDKAQVRRAAFFRIIVSITTAARWHEF